jgi:hypothetical protein
MDIFLAICVVVLVVGGVGTLGTMAYSDWRQRAK